MADCKQCVWDGECVASPDQCQGFTELKPDAKISLGASLDEAKTVICGERQDQYGNPEDSFALIADYWGTYLNLESLSSMDVAHMMMLFKIARCQGQKPKRDNYVDLQGYAAIAADRLMGG
jgi:hypothetical protein